MNTIRALTSQERDLTWRAGQERNRLQDLHGAALRAKSTKYACMAVLLLAVLFCSYAADYRVLLGLVVCAGAVRVAFLAAAVRRYDWVGLFVGMAVLCNPVFPRFALSGRVGFFLVIASITTFASSLFLLKPRLTPSVEGY